MQTEQKKFETYQERVKRIVNERLEFFGGIDNALENNIVSIRLCETQSEVFDVAKDVFYHNQPTFWNFSFRDLPEQIQDCIREDMKSDRLPYAFSVTAILPTYGGQSQNGGHNLSIVMVPYNVGPKSAKVLRVEIGCKHEFKSAEVGNCVNRYSCQKCNLTYTVDSGD